MRYAYRLLPDGPGSYRSKDIELLKGKVYTTDDERLVARLQAVPFVRITESLLATPGPDLGVPRPKYLGAVPPAPVPVVPHSVVTTATIPKTPVVPEFEVPLYDGLAEDDGPEIDAALVLALGPEPVSAPPVPPPVTAPKPAKGKAKVSRRKSP